MKKYILLLAFLLFGASVYGQATPSGMSLSQWEGFLWANSSAALSLANNFTTSGNFALTLTQTGTTNVTLPTSGTLVNTAVTSLSSLATVGTLTGGATGSGFTLAFGSSTMTGQVPVANGGTGVNTLTVHGVVIGNGGSNVNVTAQGTSGQVFTSNGAADPTWQNNKGFPVTAITADQTAASNNEYIDNKASTALLLTVPTSPTVGDKITLTIGTGVTGAKFVCIASFNFRSGGTVGVTGTGGYLQFGQAGGSCTIELTSATQWDVISAWGNITVN